MVIAHTDRLLLAHFHTADLEAMMAGSGDPIAGS
jgi:hypothetical protein